jgi:hypothetical protein
VSNFNWNSFAQRIKDSSSVRETGFPAFMAGEHNRRHRHLRAINLMIRRNGGGHHEEDFYEKFERQEEPA